MDHRTIVSFFTCQLVWVNRYPPTIWNTFAITGVHLFLLIRALDPSPDYLNEQRYLMGDQPLPPFNDHYQRLLMHK